MQGLLELQGLFEGGSYMRKYGKYSFIVHGIYNFGKSMEYLKKLDTLIDCKHFIISFITLQTSFYVRHSM